MNLLSPEKYFVKIFDTETAAFTLKDFESKNQKFPHCVLDTYFMTQQEYRTCARIFWIFEESSDVK